MTEAARLVDLLAQLPTRRMRRRLVRCVPQLDFDDSDAPSYLYTSGRPNRCNPAGVAWRLRQPTTLQELGRAISEQSAITALRFPSAASARRGLSGWNVAIYPASLETPDRVEILGRSEVPLEVLP